METDLSIRLHAYAGTAQAQAAVHSPHCADALACSRAASAAASAAIICSHTRVLRGDSRPDYLLPGQDELEVLVADKPTLKPAAEPASHTVAEPTAEPDRLRLPLRPGSGSLANLVLGADGIPAIKNRHG